VVIRLPSPVCGWIQYTSTLPPLSLIILIGRSVDLFVKGEGAPPTSAANDKTKAATIGLHMMAMVVILVVVVVVVVVCKRKCPMSNTLRNCSHSAQRCRILNG
jgi:heme/copper-type cytochrome/quinol oxidase subunit 2